jgi:hypothetical protein
MFIDLLQSHHIVIRRKKIHNISAVNIIKSTITDLIESII